MDILPLNPHDHNRDSFVISNYLELLTPSKKEKDKYICPICEGHNLSIHKDGKRYKCYDGCESKEIAYKLRKINGEFNKPRDFYIKDLLQVYKSSSRDNSDNNSSGNKKIKGVVSALSFFREIWGNDLAYNIRSKEVELKNKPISLDCIRAIIADKFDLDISYEDARETIMFLSQQNEYDPVKRYLENCYQNAEVFDITNLASSLFGTEDPLYNIYLRCWLIGCVARVLEPGCKFDEALILQGKQGYYKSTFFKVLANGFFSDSMQDPSKRDDLLVMGRHWILEWDELEKMTAKTYHSTIKAFLSKSEDTFRIPYGRDVQRVPRRSVIVGTTNQEEFLTDPTGNRRFWIIPVAKKIPIEVVKEAKDDIWASAFCEYLKGESWQLPEEFLSRQADDNQQYEIGDPWELALEDYLESQESFGVTGHELLRWLEDKGYPVSYSKTEQMRLGDVLKRKGWGKKRVMRGEQRICLWTKKLNKS